MAQKYCTECGAEIVGGGKFCTECGALLNGYSTEPVSDISSTAMPVGFAPFGGMSPQKIPTQMGKLSPVDETLTMLAEYCIKTVATVGGDGYTEWVLNRRADGNLQLDYYRNYMGYEEEVHQSCPAPADTWDKILTIKEKYNLQNPPAERNIGMCGGERLVKIRDGETAIRLVYGTLTAEENEAFSLIQKIITEIASY